ncbi:MAG: MmcQ/YjbR family DNA-binding protein [Gemmatimonadales bacterium]
MASSKRKRAATAARSRSKPPATTPLARLRAICLALPEAHEVEAWGEPTFRVKDKQFAMHASASSHHGGGRPAVWIYATHVEQDLVLRARPDRYFKPPYVGPSGWIGAWLDRSPPWAEITELLRDGYRQRAPKKLAALLGD